MKKLKNKFSKILKSDFLKVTLIYTFIFLLLTFFIVSIFNKYNRSFVWYIDGVHIHTISLRYLRDLLINFIRTGNLSSFTWKLNGGIDLFGYLAYHILGDFFSYFSLFVRTKDVISLYNILVFIRIYCIGISFLCYAKYKKFNNLSSIIGSLLISFSSFVLVALKHPFFVNQLIVFPLLMIGIEKIIVENKKIFYTILISLAYIVNFYFAYPMSLILAIYGTILAIKYYKEDGIKKIIKVLLKTLCYSLVGIMISGVIFLPAINLSFNSQRTAGNHINFYTLAYFKNIVYGILDIKSSGYWTIIGTQSLILLTLPLTIYKNRKKESTILILLLILLLPLLIAPIGAIFMGCGFPINRWSYIYPFIFSVISASFINEEQSIDKKDLLVFFISFISFILLNKIMDNNFNDYIEFQLIFLFGYLAILYYKNNLKKVFRKVNLYNIALVGMTIIGIITSIKYIYDIDGHTYVSQFIPKNSYEAYLNNANNSISDFNNAIKFISNYDNSFYKIDRIPYDYQNVPLLRNFNSVSSAINVVPKEYYDLNLDINNNKFGLVSGAYEFDYRTKINTLMGVKYFINYNNENIPYGYKKVDSYKGDSKIYENYYYLPFATLYTDYITEEEYNALSPIEKESILLKANVLKSDNGLNHYHNDDFENIQPVKFSIIDDNNIIDDKTISIKNNNKNTFEINIDNVKNSELYVLLENLNYIPYSKEEIINLNINEHSDSLSKEKIKKQYKWYQPSTEYKIIAKFGNLKKSYGEANQYTEPNIVNFPMTLISLGYYDETSGTIKISLSSLGKYTFDNLKVYAVSMDDYESDINNLRRSHFEVTNYDNGYLNGTVDAEMSGILQFQTLYKNGWKVFVDGHEAEILKSNKYFLGINLEKGKHKIHLEYHTPYLKEGIILSLVGICILITSIIYENKKRK